MGIYEIKCLLNDKVYIGSTINFERRWAEHRSQLKSKTHANPYLQNAWNKYGETNFTFRILELVIDKMDLWNREKFWIDLVHATDHTLGFNISLTPGPPIDCIAKEYIVTDPNGHEFIVFNLSEFCRQNNLNPIAMSHVALGLANQAKGWQCRYSSDSIEEWKARQIHHPKHGGGWKGDWLVTYPSGQIEKITSLTKFCLEHNLSQGNMVEVSKGKRAQHKGFKCSRYIT